MLLFWLIQIQFVFCMLHTDVSHFSLCHFAKNKYEGYLRFQYDISSILILLGAVFKVVFFFNIFHDCNVYIDCL